MTPGGEFTCRECGTRQGARAALANGARCVSEDCGEAVCVHCGCTTETACFVSQRQLLSSAPDYCYFWVPGACSNPACVERAYLSITDDEVRAAQAYYASRPRAQRPPRPTLRELRRGEVTTEGDLCHIIINELLRDDYAFILSGLDVDVFALIEGTYPAEAGPIVREIFAEWNGLVGREFFVYGRPLLGEAAAAAEVA